MNRGLPQRAFTQLMEVWRFPSPHSRTWSKSLKSPAQLDRRSDEPWWALLNRVEFSWQVVSKSQLPDRSLIMECVRCGNRKPVQNLNAEKPCYETDPMIRLHDCFPWQWQWPFRVRLLINRAVIRQGAETITFDQMSIRLYSVTRLANDKGKHIDAPEAVQAGFYRWDIPSGPVQSSGR